MVLAGSAFFSSWQLRQSACVVVVVSFTRVTSLVTRTSWQLRQPVAMAECTALPLAFSAWHSRHFAASTFLSSGTGCVFPKAGSAATPSRKRVTKNGGRIRGLGEPFRAVRLVTSGNMPLRLLHERLLIWYERLWRMRNL